MAAQINKNYRTFKIITKEYLSCNITAIDSVLFLIILITVLIDSQNYDEWSIYLKHNNVIACSTYYVIK